MRADAARRGTGEPDTQLRRPRPRPGSPHGCARECWWFSNSTTYPGTCRDIVRPVLERSGLRCGEDFFLAYSPEREDPGNSRHYAPPRYPRIVGGDGPRALDLACALYGELVADVVPVGSIEVAEAVKLTENIFRGQ